MYTSIILNLIVPGVKEALKATCTKIYFTINTIIKFGETHNFSAKDFIKNLEEFIGRQFDGVIGNSTKPAQRVLDNYS